MPRITHRRSLRALESWIEGFGTTTNTTAQDRAGKELVGVAWSGYPWSSAPTRGEAWGAGAVGTADQHAAFRFKIPAVPPGGAVDQALLRCVYDRPLGSGPWTANIAAQVGAQPPPDFSGSNLPSNWTQSTAKTAVTITGVGVVNHDITAIVNECAALAGWDGTLNLAFFNTMTLAGVEDNIRVNMSPCLLLRGITP